jgi:hypothetical protein
MSQDFAVFVRNILNSIAQRLDQHLVKCENACYPKRRARVESIKEFIDY